MPAAARLYSPQQQQTCWHGTALDGNDTVLVYEDLKAKHGDNINVHHVVHSESLLSLLGQKLFKL
jgi:hypothetical protein